MARRVSNVTQATGVGTIQPQPATHREASRHAIVRIGTNSYRVSHHRLTKRALPPTTLTLPTSVKLPPLADSRVSEYVYAPVASKSGQKEHIKAGGTNVGRRRNTVTNVDFQGKKIPNDIRVSQIAQRSMRGNVLYSWDFTKQRRDRAIEKQDWKYLTRSRVTLSPHDPLPAINESIRKASLYAKPPPKPQPKPTSRKFSKELSRFTDNLPDDTLVRFTRWHEKMLNLRDPRAPPNSAIPPGYQSVGSGGVMDYEERLAWEQRKEETEVALPYHLSPDKGATDNGSHGNNDNRGDNDNDGDADSDLATENHSLSAVDDRVKTPDQRVITRQRRVNLIDIHVPPTISGVEELSSPEDRAGMVETWLETNFRNLDQETLETFDADKGD